MMKPIIQNAIVAAVVSAFVAVPIYFQFRHSPAAVVAKDSTEVEDEGTLKLEVGELVQLDSEGDNVAWTTEPPSNDVVTYGPQNQFCVMSFRKAGRYIAIGALTKEDKVEIRKVVIIVGGGAKPGPTPGIIAPNDWSPLVATWLASVEATDQKQAAGMLADSFRAVANSVDSQIKSGKLVTAENIIAETTKANNSALGGSALSYRPFFVGLSGHLKELKSSGRLTTMVDHVNEWRKLADALEAYSQ